MALQITTIARNIAALDVAGLQIYGIDNIPADCTNLVPALIPEPLGYLANFSVVWDSQGGHGVQMMTVEYDLRYTLLYCSIGAGRTGLDYYGAMVEMVSILLDELLVNDDLTGTIDFLPVEVTEAGPVPDPAGNMFLGCRLVLHVKEFVN
jgi:hypothetical protein